MPPTRKRRSLHRRRHGNGKTDINKIQKALDGGNQLIITKEKNDRWLKLKKENEYLEHQLLTQEDLANGFSKALYTLLKEMKKFAKKKDKEIKTLKDKL